RQIGSPAPWFHLRPQPQFRRRLKLSAQRDCRLISPPRREFLQARAQARATRRGLGRVWDRATVDPAARDRDLPTNQSLNAAVSNFAASRLPHPCESQKHPAPFGSLFYAENFRDL